MDRRVSLLYLVNPDIKLVSFYHEHALEIYLWSDQGRNLDGKKRKENEATELQKDREDVFFAILASIITITDGRQNRVHPVTRKYVDLPRTVNLELFVSTRFHLQHGDPSVISRTQCYPSASAHVSKE